ncbi:hypothetical protein C6497_08010 [Candidatus Poribacteria bacterium]|nr:MAG: hypothetical protein C6497_08010 [Candidatus Poribacteria bacterium]
MMKFTPNQQKALTIDKHVCVTAGAGSGKTTVLVERYLEILRSGNITPSQIVAITFTKKAAAEIKARIIKEIHEERNRKVRENYIEEMNTAPISTFHAFCARILREYPFDAKIPASFTIIEGIEQKILLREVIKNAFDNIVSSIDNPFYSHLEFCLYRTRNKQFLTDLLTDMVNERSSIEILRESVYENIDNTDIPQRWYEAFNAPILTEKELSNFMDNLYSILEISKGRNVEKTRELLQQISTLSVQNEDNEEQRRLLIEITGLISTAKNEIATRYLVGINVDKTDIADNIELVLDKVKKIKSAPVYDANTNFETDDELLYKISQNLLPLYDLILKNYQEIKFTQGKLDNQDLQLKTVYLLKNNLSVRQKIRKQFKYYMIDEYQDTNEIQSELVNLLTNNLNDSNLFIVGDPKQSIYGFRGADVRVFDETKQKIKELDGEDISLQENYRSLRDVVGFVNSIFKRQDGDQLENEFDVIYEPLHKARSADGNGSVEIILRQEEYDISESDLIAQKIKSMIDSKVKIWEQGEDIKETPRAIQYGDITILIRSRGHLPTIETALNKFGIPYLTSGGIGFYQRQEIYDIWNYLNFLSNPDGNDTSLIGVLRGPAFGISDVEIFEISHLGKGSFWDNSIKYKSPSKRLCQAIATLKNHIEIAKRMSINRLIQTIVNDTGMIGAIKTGNKGEQKWANYKKLLELAGTYDGDEFSDLLDEFVKYLDILISEEPLEGDAPVEESSSAVKIMTIHSAKGKEFPVVILPSLDRQTPTTHEPIIDDKLGVGFSPLRPEKEYHKTEPVIVPAIKDRKKSKENAEEKRVFYVGVTRARDRLILSGSINEEGKSKNRLQEIIEILEFSNENDMIQVQVKLDVYSDGETIQDIFQLPIPIIKQIGEIDNRTPFDEITNTPPELPYDEIEKSNYASTFNVQELAIYGLCPLRFYLENVLNISALGVDSRPEETQILDQQNENLLSSELAELKSSSLFSVSNQQIHTKLDKHIIYGRLNWLVKEESGIWHGIKVPTDNTENMNVLSTEMELYGLLLYANYPNQQTIHITCYSPFLKRHIEKSFVISDLPELRLSWIERISNLQHEDYTKNLEHCNFCPYSDLEGNCIVNET